MRAKLSVLLAAGLMLAVAGCAKVAVNPVPTWTQPSGLLRYEHWECPSGYTVDVGAGAVWCTPDDQMIKRMEDYNRSLKPVEKP